MYVNNLIFYDYLYRDALIRYYLQALGNLVANSSAIERHLDGQIKDTSNFRIKKQKNCLFVFFTWLYNYF